MFLKNRNAADDNASPPYKLLLPYEDEIVENTTSFILLVTTAFRKMRW